jgi:3',5'-cyclic-AMP phosphodiesterase
MAFRLGAVTAVHHGPDTPVRPGHVALPLLGRFVDEMRARFRPRAIIDLGDRINDVGPAEDARHIADVMRALRGAGVPVLALHGNHDVVNLDVRTVTGLLGRTADYESADHGGVHLVLLTSQDPMRPGGGGTLSDAQLDWLTEDLRAASAPVLVFSHHPLDEQDESGHWYFPTHPG